MTFRRLLVAILVSSATLARAQDVVVSDMAVPLGPLREGLAVRPAAPLGTVNDYLTPTSQTRGLPLTTWQLVYDPTVTLTEGYPVTKNDVTRPAVIVVEKPSFFQRIVNSIFGKKPSVEPVKAEKGNSPGLKK